MRRCDTDPKAFFRSRNDITNGKPCWIALSRMEQVEKICSIQPFMPDRKPF